jgi:hypothetical protein
MAVAVGVWGEADQAAYERTVDPRAPPAVVARRVAYYAPRGCHAVLDLGNRLAACPLAVVPGRAFCSHHAPLGWCDRACAWTPRPVAPPRPPPERAWSRHPPVSWTTVAKRLGRTSWLGANPPLPPVASLEDELDARADLRAAADRLDRGLSAAIDSTLSPVWDRVGVGTVWTHRFPHGDR